MFPKSLNSLSAVLTGQSLDETSFSNNYIQSIRKINNLYSKKQEKVFFKHEIQSCKNVLSKADTKKNEIKECLLKLVFFHLLDYDVSFAFIHAIHLAQSSITSLKKTGYLLSSLFLGDSNELSVLLVNTISKDLKSDQHDQTALTACCHIIHPDHISSIIEDVFKKINSHRSRVRLKALMCLKALIHKQDNYFQTSTPKHKQTKKLIKTNQPIGIHSTSSYHSHPITTRLIPSLIKCLYDKEPQIVLMAVETIRYLYQHDSFLTLGNNDDFLKQKKTIISKACIDILTQISSKESTPIECQYHGVPNPWFQISLLKLLTSLATDSQECTEMMVPLMKHLCTLDTSVRAGLMIVYEVIRSLTQLSYILLDDITPFVDHVRLFFDSKFPNVKLTGLKLLSMLAAKDQSLILPFQSIILACLTSSDHQIINATLTLMKYISNPTNKNVVCLKLLGQLDTIIDTSSKSSSSTTSSTFCLPDNIKINNYESDMDDIINDDDVEDIHFGEDKDNIEDDDDENEVLKKNITCHIVDIIFRFALEDCTWSVEMYFKLLLRFRFCSSNNNINNNTKNNINNNNNIFMNNNKSKIFLEFSLTRKLLRIIEDVEEESKRKCMERACELSMQCLLDAFNNNNNNKNTQIYDIDVSVEKKNDVFENEREKASKLHCVVQVQPLLASVEIIGMYPDLNPTSHSSEVVCSQLLKLFKATTDRFLRRMCLFALVKIFPYLSDKTTVIQSLEELKRVLAKSDFAMKIGLSESICMCEKSQYMPSMGTTHEAPDFSLSFLDERICEYIESGGMVYKHPTNQQPPSILISMQEEKEEVTVCSSNLFEDAAPMSKPESYLDLLNSSKDSHDESEEKDGCDEYDSNFTGWTTSGYRE